MNVRSLVCYLNVCQTNYCEPNVSWRMIVKRKIVTKIFDKNIKRKKEGLWKRKIVMNNKMMI